MFFVYTNFEEIGQTIEDLRESDVRIMSIMKVSDNKFKIYYC